MMKSTSQNYDGEKGVETNLVLLKNPEKYTRCLRKIRRLRRKCTFADPICDGRAHSMIG